MKRILDRFPINDLVPSCIETPELDAIHKKSPANPERLSAIRILMLLNHKPFIKDLKEVNLADPFCLLHKWKVQTIIVTPEQEEAKKKMLFCDVVGDEVEDVEEKIVIRLVDLKFGIIAVFGGGDVPEGHRLVVLPISGAKAEVLAAIKKLLRDMKPPKNPIRGGIKELQEKLLMVRYCLGPNRQLTPEKLAKQLVSSSPALRAAREKNKAESIRNMLKQFKKDIILP